MQLRGHENSRRNLRVGAIILLILGAVAIGAGSVGDAVAIDRPKHLSKAFKKKELSKAKGVELGQNPSTANPIAGQKREPGAAALSKNALGKDALNKNALSKNTNTASTIERRRLQVEHRREILTTRLRLPHRPLPGERGFTGVPPLGETRFVSTEMVFQVGSNVSRQTIENAVRRLGLSTIASQNVGLTGGTL